MKTTITWLAWLATGLLALLVALNWQTMTASAPLNLVFVEWQVPLGLLVLGIAAVPLALFFVAYLQQQIRTLVETRRLLRDVQQAHELADKAEASRVEGLRLLLGSEFRALNERLDSLGAVLPDSGAQALAPTAPRLGVLTPWRNPARTL